MFGWTHPQGCIGGNPEASHSTYDPVLLGAGAGFVEGTHVASQQGWTPIEDLRVGDKVLTFDNGAQKITSIVRNALWNGPGPCPESFWPLLIEEDTIGNGEEMLLMPHQGVLIESEEIMDHWGDPFAVIPAAALLILEGVERCEPVEPVEIILPVFETDQMVYADFGALLFCQAQWGVNAGVVPRQGMATNYNMLPRFVAEKLLAATYMCDNIDYDVA
ncbi:Hint domain-containing protein [Shimia sp. SDUM112013]|uniref:Hint domain-containing protein n=1 Tax=Shimia sp. SDUM112013 TaxID=3136160 RepID=UPI0032ED69FD